MKRQVIEDVDKIRYLEGTHGICTCQGETLHPNLMAMLVGPDQFEAPPSNLRTMSLVSSHDGAAIVADRGSFDSSLADQDFGATDDVWDDA